MIFRVFAKGTIYIFSLNDEFSNIYAITLRRVGKSKKKKKKKRRHDHNCDLLSFLCNKALYRFWINIYGCNFYRKHHRFIRGGCLH